MSEKANQRFPINSILLIDTPRSKGAEVHCHYNNRKTYMSYKGIRISNPLPSDGNSASVKKPGRHPYRGVMTALSFHICFWA